MTCRLKSSKEIHFYTKDKNLQRHDIYHVSGFDRPLTAKEFKRLFEII